MQKITIPTAFNIDLEFETAEFLQRLVAWLIDFAIVMAYFIVSMHFLAEYEASNGRQSAGDGFWFNLSALQMILFTPCLVYHLVCELLMNGQTPGKKMLKLRVISENGGRPALYQFLLRWLVRFIDFISSFGFGALISYAVTNKNQRLGDLAAGTLVIKLKMQSNLDDTIFFELGESYQPVYANVLKLTDRDMNTIKNMLDRYHTGKTSLDMIIRTADTIRAALGIPNHQDNIIFLETLLKDYNHLSVK
ncbi:RDD family protein [Filimonas effusa]|uniref:RDD family protein n=1 Tax=Filimonas effusa TaxID=2508721 RepID=A0A4Q1DCS0_9BACT|nr:RDD family protein [Filimonas effusa]RXK86339.1 RDD family protein [Filimonas effusa]